MISDSEMLNYVRQNTEMGIDGIKVVLKHTKDNDLRRVLMNQETEYRSIYEQADHMLHERNETTDDLNPMSKMAVKMSDMMKEMTAQTTEKIAESMIKGSTMGITKIVKQMSEYDGDVEIKKLAQRLKSTEENNIEQLKPFALKSKEQ